MEGGTHFLQIYINEIFYMDIIGIRAKDSFESKVDKTIRDKDNNS
jgi:hypothetical protein